jgi:pSer/pThr/pTyr-binding forkhead associated (FHA) protein
MIDTKDEYMGRNHFVITVEQNRLGDQDYCLADNNSMNKTFINTVKLQELKKGDEYLLQDGDIIQAGYTKIVFKSNKTVKTEKEATKLVVNQPKGKTVLV